MSFVIYFLCAVVGGVVGGMGMGGGTLLIPLLTLVCEVEQHTAQAVNLLAFIPMALVSLAQHSKNGLLVKDKVLWIIIPAALASLAAGFLAVNTRAAWLRLAFGIFLIVLSAYQFFVAVITLKREKSRKKSDKAALSRQNDRK